MAKFKKLLPTILMLIFEVLIGVLLLIDGEKFTEVIFIIFGILLLVSGLISLISTMIRSAIILSTINNGHLFFCLYGCYDP